MAAYESWALEASSADPDDTPAWVDITSWARTVGRPIRIERGARAERTDAQNGTLSAALDNADHRFTTDNPSSPFTWWGQGRKLRLRETADGQTFYRFTGYQKPTDLTDWAEEDVDQLAALNAVDLLGRLDRAPAFRGVLAECIRSQPGLVDWWPLDDADSHTEWMSELTNIVLRRVTQGWSTEVITADPDQLLVPGGMEGPPGDDVSYAQWAPVGDAAGNSAFAEAYLDATVDLEVGLTDTIAVSAWVNLGDYDMEPTSEEPQGWTVNLTSSTHGMALMKLYQSLPIDAYYNGCRVYDPTAAAYVNLDAGREYERYVWRLVTVRYTMSTGTIELFVGADVSTSTTTTVPASPMLLDRLRVGLSWSGGIAHLQIRIGAGVMSRAEHLAQYAAGMSGHHRQTVAERLGLLAGYAGVHTDALSTALLVDEFGRTASSWGSADTGQAWTTAGGSASDYNVSGGVGTISVGSLGASRNVLSTDTVTDVDVRAVLRSSVVATGANINAAIVARWVSGTEFYRFMISFKPGGTLSYTITRRNLASGFAAVSTGDVPGLTYTAGSAVNVRVQAIGDVLRIRVWTSTAEPVTWLAEIRDTAIASGVVGIRAEIDVGNTNTLPVIVSVDSLRVGVPSVSASTPMQVAKLAGRKPGAALRAAAATEGGGRLLVAGDGTLTMQPRTRRYNQAVDHTIPYAWLERGLRYREVEPVTVATASRVGGGSTRRTDTDAARRYGVAEAPTTLDTAIDADTANWASFTLRTGSTPRMRCPQLRINLLPRTEAERAQLLAIAEGDRIQITDLPATAPAGTGDLIVEGIVDEIGVDVRFLNLNTSPLLGETAGTPPSCPVVGDLVSASAIVAY